MSEGVGLPDGGVESALVEFPSRSRRMRDLDGHAVDRTWVRHKQLLPLLVIIMLQREKEPLRKTPLVPLHTSRTMSTVS